MTDKPSPLNLDDLIAAQSEYWDSWSSAFLKSVDSPGLSGSESEKFWTDGLDSWWQSLSAYMPEDETGMYQRMMGHGKTFAQISEHLKNIIQTVKQVNRNAEGWQDELRSRFNQLKSDLHDMPLDMRNLEEMQKLTGLPVEAWQHAMKESALFGEDYLDPKEGTSWTQARAKLHSVMEMFLSIPPTGPDREKQERLQRGAKLSLDNQRAIEAYTDAHALLVTDGLDRLCSRIIERGEEGDDLRSLREIYDLWVDCGEDAYADFVMTEQYAELYGDLANTSMRLKLHVQDEMDDLLTQLGVPNRKEMDSALKKQHQMRREISALHVALEKSQQSIVESRDLQQQLKELQQTVMDLKQQLVTQQQPDNKAKPVSKADPAKVAPTARKKVARKKVAKKKTTRKKAATPKPTTGGEI